MDKCVSGQGVHPLKRSQHAGHNLMRRIWTQFKCTGNNKLESKLLSTVILYIASAFSTWMHALTVCVSKSRGWVQIKCSPGQNLKNCWPIGEHCSHPSRLGARQSNNYGLFCLCHITKHFKSLMTAPLLNICFFFQESQCFPFPDHLRRLQNLSPNLIISFS